MIKASTIVLHPNYIAARSKLLRDLESAKPGDIFLLIGPSGSGKTEICCDVMCSIAGDFRQWGMGRLPVLYMLASQADKNFFSPKHFMSQLYAGACHPKLDWLTPRGKDKSPGITKLEEEISSASTLWKLTRKPGTEMDLRDAFVDIAPIRGIRYVFVDDGRALTMNRRSVQPASHLLSYMTLAADAKIVLCLIGTHVLTQLSDPMAEPGRRSEEVYVDRYRINTLEERTLLASLCTDIANFHKYPLEPPSLIVESLGAISLATGGVYAHIESLFKRADAERKRLGSQAITIDHLKSAFPREGKLISRWKDIKTFDKLLEPADFGSINRLVKNISAED